MEEFFDVYGEKVQFLFEPNSFLEKASHVWVICKYEKNWLLTKHKKRGWEFPGGKVEPNESLEQAACREVWEETGALVKELIAIGSYKVTDSKGFFIKKVFYGVIDKMVEKIDYHETNGPVLVSEEVLLKERYENKYSFIMQDQVIELCMQSLLMKK